MMNISAKILILGLDGATWRLLNPLMAAGELPNLQKLCQTGAHGSLFSAIPPLTAPAWVTFQTGANSGKHSIFDFRLFDRATRNLWLASARDVQLPTLWQLASEVGKQVIAINVPVTYPPQPVNGIVIGGMLAQSEDESLIYPPSRAPEILARHPNYRISPPVISQRKVMGRRTYVDAAIQTEHHRAELALDLLQHEPWDVFMVQNQCLDYIQHAYYHLLDRAAPEFDEAGYADVIRFFRAMDDNVGRMVAAAPAHTDIVVVSDHGFKLQHRLVHLAPWLRDNGYLIEALTPRQRLMQLLRRADVLKLRRHLAHWVLRGKTKRFGAAAQSAITRIVWAKSRAFTAIGSISGCIYINRDIVDDVDGLKRELADKLKTMTDPQTGRRVVERVLFGDDIYSGPYAVNGPDIIVEPAEDFTFGAPSLIAHQKPFTDIDFELEIPGGHHPEGIFIWAGPGVPAAEHSAANLMDIAPTVLARMGLSVPNHMDGRVLGHLFDTPPEADFYDWMPTSVTSGAAYSADDEAALTQRLSDLGYL